jgi:hypothetical protein
LKLQHQSTKKRASKGRKLKGKRSEGKDKEKKKEGSSATLHTKHQRSKDK